MLMRDKVKFLFLLVIAVFVEGLEETNLITVPPESRNASVGDTVTFTCISPSPIGQILTAFGLSATPTVEGMTRSSDITLENGDRRVSLDVTVPSGHSEIVVTCSAIKNVHEHDSKSAKLMIQGLLSGVSNLTSSEVDHCTPHFTWTAPYTLQGVPINYYTINITRHSDGTVLRSDTTNTTEYLYTAMSSLRETLEVVVAAVNGAGTGNVSSIISQPPQPSIKVVKDGTERRSNTDWSYTFTIIDEHGMSECGNAISNAIVEACLNPSFCVNSSETNTFNTLPDGSRMTNITFTELAENRNYSHSTIYLFLNENTVMSQQVPISTFDVQKTSLDGSIIGGKVCLNIEFAVGSASTNCSSKFKSSDTGYTVHLVTTTETSICVSNVPPISVDILSTDPDAVDEIDTNPAYILPGVVVPDYIIDESTTVTDMIVNSISSATSTTTTSSSNPVTNSPPSYIPIITGILLIMAYAMGCPILLFLFYKRNKLKEPRVTPINKDRKYAYPKDKVLTTEDVDTAKQHSDSIAMLKETIKELQTGETLKQNPESVESFRMMSKVKFDVRGLKYHMPDHGITVIIPENAVDAEAQICIGVYYIEPSHDQLPKGHRLVSEVFWIYISVRLQKCVELYLPLFAEIRNENDSKKLSFFMTSDESYMSSGVLKFVEAPTNSCTFEPGSCYGKVVLDHFCSGCILENVDVDKLPLRYCITKIFPKDYHSCTNEEWKADFVFSYALPSCLKVIEKQYSSNKFSLETHSVTFTQPSATLDFSDEPVEGWFIEPGMLRKITEENIDFRQVLLGYQSGDIKSSEILKQLENLKQYPPRLSLKVIRSQHAQKNLWTDVKITGVKPDLICKLFILCPGIRRNPQQLIIEEPLPERHQYSSLAEKDEVKFLRELILALQDPLIKDWYTFGLYLDLDPNELNVIECNSINYADKRSSVRCMLTTWKARFGKGATWDKIVDALRNIRQNALAQDLRAKHLQSAEQKETVPKPFTSRDRTIPERHIWLTIVTTLIAILIVVWLK